METEFTYGLIISDDERTLKRFLFDIEISVDDIVKKSRDILGITVTPDFKIVLLKDKQTVIDQYKKDYGKDVDYVAYNSRSRKTIWISVKNADLKMIAHEISHVLINQYFTEPMPPRPHELLAQYVEREIVK